MAKSQTGELGLMIFFSPAHITSFPTGKPGSCLWLVTFQTQWLYPLDVNVSFFPALSSFSQFRPNWEKLSEVYGMARALVTFPSEIVVGLTKLTSVLEWSMKSLELLKKWRFQPRVMAPQLRVLVTALIKDLCSVPSTHVMAASKYLLLASPGTRHTCGTHAYMRAKHNT